MHKPAKRIDLVLDNCTYTPDLFQAAVDLAVAYKHTGQAQMRLIVPPALLYELSGYKATCERQLLDPALRKDKGVRALRALVSQALEEKVLHIPRCTDAELEFFTKHKLRYRERTHTANLPGPRAPLDFGDHAIAEWLRNNPPSANHHFVVSTQDDGVMTSLMDSIPGNPNGKNHLNYYEHFDQKSTAQWLAEEARDLQQQTSLDLQRTQPRVVHAFERLNASVSNLDGIKSGRGQNEHLIR